MNTTLTTPRDVRHQLNKMERWCQKHAAQLGPAAVKLRGMFEVAHTAEHAEYLAGEIRDLVRQLELPDDRHDQPEESVT